MNRILIATILLIPFVSTVYAQSVYDESTNQLSVPAIKVGNTVYTDVVITVGEVLSVAGSYIDASATYNLQAAYDLLISQPESRDFELTGESEGISVTGTGTVTSGSLMPGMFEGMSAQVRAIDSSFVLEVFGSETPFSSSSLSYYDSSNRFLGSDGEGYEVVDTYYDLPVAASSGDTGLIYQSTLYTDASKSTVEGKNTVTYTTTLDSDNTLTLTVISVLKDLSGETLQTITRRWRIFADNSVTRLGETLLDSSVFLTISYQ